MSSSFYALNICTLATWLSVAGMGAVGWAIPIWHLDPYSTRAGETTALRTRPEISLGTPEKPTGAAVAVASPPEVQPPITEPPELPSSPELAPLPDLPDLPDPQAARSAPIAETTPTRPASKPAQRVSSKPVTARQHGAAAEDDKGQSDAARIAAGRMPPPIYPEDARRKGQSGTVLIEFIVGTDGRVISAYPKHSSHWPILDNEAVRTVRSWKFPPGTVMKQQRQIDFQLK